MLSQQSLYDEQSEMALLGCILLDSERVMFLLNDMKFTPEMFYGRAHQVIFLSIQGMISQRRHVDVITLQERLRSKGHLDEVGGYLYLTRLMEAPSNSLAAPHYAEAVLEKHRTRKLVDIGRQIETSVMEGAGSAEISANLMEGLMEEQGRAEVIDPKTLHEASMQQAKTVHDGGQRAGWPSFLEPLNAILGSYLPGYVYIVAGSPSNGKTSLTCNEIAHKAVDLEVPSAFFSMEMSEQTIRQSMAATIAGVDAFKFFLMGRYNDLEADCVRDAFDKLLKAPLYIVDRRMTIEQINSRIAFLVKKHGVRFVGLDYLQLIRYSRTQQKLTRNEQVAEWSATLKEDALKFNFALLLVSQLSRLGIKSRELTPPPPALEALRDSGSIEQDADGVIFVYKKPGEPYDSFVTEWPMEIDCAKNRGGPVGTIKATFRRNRQKFVSQQEFEQINKQQQLNVGG